MNEKIKEILAELTSIQLRYTKPLLLKDSKDELIDDYEELVLKMLHIITNLQEENERLKNREKEVVEHYNIAIKYSHEIEDKYINYKSRCEKATELIEKSRVKATPFFKQFDGDLIMPKREVDKLLNLLNGGDEE